MKKILLATVMAIVMTTSAHAACEGGTLSDDGKFCISNIDLNWWSAANWCKANGRHLATIYEVCPDWDGNTGNGKCPVIASSINRSAWTATASGSDLVFRVNPSDGHVSYNLRDGTLRALCQQFASFYSPSGDFPVNALHLKAARFDFFSSAFVFGKGLGFYKKVLDSQRKVWLYTPSFPKLGRS